MPLSTTKGVKQKPATTVTAADVAMMDDNGDDDKKRLEQIIKDNDNKYPKSNFYIIGNKLIKDNHLFLAIDAYKRGCIEIGCVPCMIQYIFCLIATNTTTNTNSTRGGEENNNNNNNNCKTIIHLAVPFLLEGAIRGNVWCMQKLYVECYYKAQPVKADAIIDYWLKGWEGEFLSIKKRRRNAKNRTSSICYICHLTDFDDDITLVKCGKCKYYSYCGKVCQLKHWNDDGHIGECRQLCILHKYHKPYATEIRESIQNGVDPKSIHRLQTLRTKLGLNRPMIEYEGLMESLSSVDDDNNSNNNNNNNRLNQYQYIVARKDGTVHIGSTPEAI